jgi:hypothetical protein
MATSPLEGRALVQVCPWRCPCRLHWSFDLFMRRSRHDCCCRTEVWYANRSLTRARLCCGPKRLPGRCQDRDYTGNMRECSRWFAYHTISNYILWFFAHLPLEKAPLPLLSDGVAIPPLFFSPTRKYRHRYHILDPGRRLPCKAASSLPPRIQLPDLLASTHGVVWPPAITFIHQQKEP